MVESTSTVRACAAVIFTRGRGLEERKRSKRGAALERKGSSQQTDRSQQEATRHRSLVLTSRRNVRTRNHLTVRNLILTRNVDGGEWWA